MTDEFRPERFVIASDFAAELDEGGLAISKVRHHEDGSAELVLEPTDYDSPPADDAPAEGVMGDFIAGCFRSGMQENICVECGRPWLTRENSALCPVCNPKHVGYYPGGAPPHDRARWVAFWRNHLTGVLRARAADHQYREKLLRHQEAIGWQFYPPNALATRIIGNLGRSFEPRLDESDPEWIKGWEKGSSP